MTTAQAAILTLKDSCIELGPRLGTILDAVAAHTSIPRKDIIGPYRDRAVVDARFVYYWLARNLTTASLPKIGYYCGHKDHTTVLHGIREVNRRMDEFGADLDRIKGRIG